MRHKTNIPSRSGKGSKSYSNLIIIVVFSACLLFGYIYINSPKTGSSVARKTLSSFKFTERFTGHGTGQTVEDTSLITAGHPVTTIAGLPTASDSGANEINKVSDTDARHPDNVGLVMAQQSSHDEHHSTEVTASNEQSDGAQVQSQADTAQGDASAIQAANAEAVSPMQQDTATAATANSSTSNDPALATADANTDTASEHELSSGVTATAASLAHATEHLKEATKMLAEKAEEMKKAEAETSTTGEAQVKEEEKPAEESKSTDEQQTEQHTSDSQATATEPAAGSNQTTAPEVKPPPVDPATLPDLLAYSKEQNQPGDTIHVLFTSNGSPYQNFQARIMVGTYNLVRKMPNGEKLVAITRILHRTTPDEVMDEIPTFRANPLQPECDKWCWFPVADRANAMQQWVDAAHKDHTLVKAPWVLLLETDYVWVKPLQAMGSAYDPAVPGLAYKFDYIAPQNPIVGEILKDKCPSCDPASVPGSGPAPVLMRFSDLRAATPLWEELSLWIETHEHAKKQLGWVREMYAWDIGVAANKLNIKCEGHPATTLISQPPHDSSLYNATMYHYTWGCILKDANLKDEIWKFDKRFWVDPKDALKIPQLPLPPPWTPGLKVHDGTPWTEALWATMTDMLTHMNNAIATLPDLSDRLVKT